MDKNEFRYIEDGDLIRVRPVKKKSWIRDFIDTIKEEFNSMMELLK